MARWIAVGLALALGGCGGGATGDDDDDLVAPDAGAPGAGSEYVFDDDALRTYDLTLDPGDWQWLNDNAALEQYVQGTLDFEGRTYGPIGVRYKGGYGTLYSCFDDAGNRTCPKLSIKLKFNEYDPEGRFYGLKRLNFHSMIRDESLMRDRLAYAMFREMEVAAPRAVHALITVNGEPLGLFALVEQIDGRFTRSRFPDGGEGNLYKEVWPEHVTEQPYLNALKTNEDEMPTADKMVRFAQDLAAADPSTIDTVLAQWMDVDALMRYLAVDRTIENWDGIVAWYCPGGTCFNHNYYWYEETARDRVWLIPWDMDNTYADPSPVIEFFGMPEWDDTGASCELRTVFNGIPARAPACDPIIRYLATVFYDRYVDATAAFLAGPFQLDLLYARVDHIEAQIADAVATDAYGPGTAAWQQAVTDLRADLAALRADAEAVIAP